MDASTPLPLIYLYRCTGCGRCVDHCPVRALVSRNGKVQLAEPNRCTYCTRCEEVCPADAIALPFLVVFAGAEDKTAMKRPPSPLCRP